MIIDCDLKKLESIKREKDLKDIIYENIVVILHKLSPISLIRKFIFFYLSQRLLITQIKKIFNIS